MISEQVTTASHTAYTMITKKFKIVAVRQQKMGRKYKYLDCLGENFPVL